MAKIKCWLNLLKKLFVSDSKVDPEKREKKRRWFIGRFKRNRLPALAAPSLKDRSLIEAKENCTNHAFTAAVATAVAAEAALASAQAAVEIIRLSGTPPPCLKSKARSRVVSAAIKIQTAFRGYLARKALRAMKGVVRLQAMIRGQAVRRQVITALNGLQTLVKIQSKLRVKNKSWGDEEFVKNSNEFGEKKTRPEVSRQRSLVNALPSKEDIDAMFLRRHEALIKKARVKEHSLTQKEKISSMKHKASEANNVNGSLDQWLGQMADAQESKSNPVIISNQVQRNAGARTGLGLGDSRCHDLLAGRASPVTPPRRSFDRPTRSTYEDSDSQGSPIVPNYMLSTESAKARLRSVSLPKRGPGSLDMYSDHSSPYRNMLIFSSINTDGSVTIKSGKAPSSQQRSPSLKGVSGPIRSYQSPKDLSVNSNSSEWSQMVFSKVGFRE